MSLVLQVFGHKLKYWANFTAIHPIVSSSNRKSQRTTEVIRIHRLGMSAHNFVPNNLVDVVAI